jgi:hypothetical protein
MFDIILKLKEQKKTQNKVGVGGGERGRSATGAVRSRYTGHSERRVGEMSIEACGLAIRSSISGTLYTLSTCSGPWSRERRAACFRDSKSEIFPLLRAHVKTTTKPNITHNVTHVKSPFLWSTLPRGWVIGARRVKCPSNWTFEPSRWDHKAFPNRRTPNVQ